MILIKHNIEQITNILNKFKFCLESLKTKDVDIKEIALKFLKYATIAVTYKDNEIIGFISFYCNDKQNKVAYISMIAVLPEHRQKGIGNKLIEEALEYCRKNEMKCIRLEVRKKNINVLDFYKKLGFEIEMLCTNNSIYLYKQI